tara:strand:+ start:53 stop:844 length:792 start_codon:yes stop_codon:yes gene_type:complete
MSLALIAAAALSQAQAAPPPPEVEAVRAQQMEQLDAWLAQDDYRAIGDEVQALSDPVEAAATLDWLGRQFQQGESAFISWQYSELLSAFAQGPKGEGLKGTALAAMLYTIAASSIEARQCADKTAWSDRARTFTRHLMQGDLLDQPQEMRELAVRIALAMEQRTWDRRKQMNDAEFLCMNGMAAMSAGISGGSMREEAPAEGQVGRQIRVSPPEDFVYERRENADWWPDAEALRAQLPQALVVLAGLASRDHAGESAEDGPGE